MQRIQKEIIIKNSQGLHARPAAMFVQIVSKYDSNVTIQKGEVYRNYTNRSKSIFSPYISNNGDVFIDDDKKVLLVKQYPSK